MKTLLLMVLVASLAPREVPVWVSCPPRPETAVSPPPGEACGYLREHPVGSCVLYTLQLRLA